MSITVYSCDTPGIIVPIIQSQEKAGFVLSQYFIVEKYEYLYEHSKNRFGAANTPYALPGKGKNIRPYYGLDREPMAHTPDITAQFTFADISAVLDSLPDKKNYEIIYANVVNSNAAKPEGMSFLGYDICYPLDGDGFSIICDCMFICRWHGCDEKGTEFIQEFKTLNQNGLFDSKEDAIHYLYHYLSQDWAETGEFCIVEIYR